MQEENNDVNYIDERRKKVKALTDDIVEYTTEKVVTHCAESISGAHHGIDKREIVRDIQRGLDVYDQLVRAVQEVAEY